MAKTSNIIQRLPSFYHAAGDESVLHRFVEVFSQLLEEAEVDLVEVMRSHWVDKADNEGSRGFDTTQKGDLDKIFSLYLESLGGTSLLKQVDRPAGEAGLEHDETYRDRIKGLIGVLIGGASNRDGIVSIVAANLGIVGDDPAAVACRSQIRIEEFLPTPVTVASHQLAVADTFSATNPNVAEVRPEIRVRLRDDLVPLLVDPEIVNLTTGAVVRYQGTVGARDNLSFFPDGTASLNGIPVPVDGHTPLLPVGTSQWRFDAAFGLPAGRFDRTPFDLSLFERQEIRRVGLFNHPSSRFDDTLFAFIEPVARIDMSAVELTPGVFTVRIPWDCPPFTDRLDQFADDPRSQITYIVDKVNAAGVRAIIAYEKRLYEQHETDDALVMAGSRRPLTDSQDMEETRFSLDARHNPEGGAVTHDLDDELVLEASFDRTTFDSLNGFA